MKAYQSNLVQSNIVKNSSSGRHLSAIRANLGRGRNKNFLGTSSSPQNYGQKRANSNLRGGKGADNSFSNRPMMHTIDGANIKSNQNYSNHNNRDFVQTSGYNTNTSNNDHDGGGISKPRSQSTLPTKI